MKKPKKTTKRARSTDRPKNELPLRVQRRVRRPKGEVCPVCGDVGNTFCSRFVRGGIVMSDCFGACPDCSSEVCSVERVTRWDETGKVEPCPFKEVTS